MTEIIGQHEIGKGVSRDHLIKLANNPKTKVIQFSSQLSSNEFDLLEKIVFSKRPDILLRIYGHYNEECNLTLIERIPSLRKISADNLMKAKGIEVVSKLENLEILGIGVNNLENFDFIEDINSELKELSIHKTKSKKPRINSISRFEKLEFLYLDGQQKGINSLNQLKNLKRIVLRSVSTKDLNFLSDLIKLWSVDIKLGGVKNFDALETLENLKFLELWQIRGLNDLSFISKLNSLQNLFVQSLKQLSKFPNLNNLKKLRRIYLEDLKELKDLSSITLAPSLEEFIYISAQNLTPQDLISVLKNTNLKSILCGFGSEKKNNEFNLLAKEFGKKEYRYTKFEYN